MFCEKCGSQLIENAKFCGKCGATVAAQAKTIAPTVLLSEMQKEAVSSTAEAIKETKSESSEPMTEIPSTEEVEVTTKEQETATADGTVLLGAAGNDNEEEPRKKGTGTQPVAPAQLKKKKKKSKAGLIIGLVCFVIAIGGCAGIFWWLNRPINKIENAISSGDFDVAGEIFAGIEDEAELKAIKEQAREYAKSVKDNYLNEVEGMDYATVSNILEELHSDILSDDEEVSVMIALVESINDSRASFESAEKFKAAGRYADAITEYGKVIEEDTSYYELAQTSLAETIDIFRTDALDTAKTYQDNGEYKEAKDVLDEALEVLKNDASLLSELKVVQAYIQDEVLEEALDEIKTAVAEGKYAVAFAAVTKAEESLTDNASIEKAKAELITSYKTAKLAEVESYYTSNDIESALEVLNAMKAYLPDDSEVALLITQYTSYLPTQMSELTVYEYNNRYASYESGLVLTDTYENKYEDAIRLMTTYSNGYGELVYLVNEKYNYFSCDLAYELCDNTKGTMYVDIYADGILTKSTGVINDSTRPFSIVAELGENCHKLTIKWRSEGNYNANIIMSDAQVYKR